MLSVDAHLDHILSVVQPLSSLQLGLMDAHGCVLTEDVVATDPLPGFDNSAVDGYAVRLDDVAAATERNPVVLPVTGDVAAGPASPLRVQPGVCVRIMTGAMMPAGADSVIPVEWTDGGVASVTILRAPGMGANIRRAGEDVVAGETVLPGGTHLGAVQIGLAAAVGRSRLIVRPRPRVVVVSTGTELTEAGQPLTPGRIVDSNSPALTAAALEAGAIAYRVGIVPDDPRKLAATLEDQLVRADLLVTSGGVSVGAYDVVKEVLSRLGTVAFDRIAMQPGMPQGFGYAGLVPVITLPGNPVSAFVSFEAFVRPLIRKALGHGSLTRPVLRGTLARPLRSPGGKRQFQRGRYDDGTVHLIGGPPSHLLASLAMSDCLVVIPEDVTELAAGAEVEVWTLR